VKKFGNFEGANHLLLSSHPSIAAFPSLKSNAAQQKFLKLTLLLRAFVPAFWRCRGAPLKRGGRCFHPRVPPARISGPPKRSRVEVPATPVRVSVTTVRISLFIPILADTDIPEQITTECYRFEPESSQARKLKEFGCFWQSANQLNAMRYTKRNSKLTNSG